MNKKKLFIIEKYKDNKRVLSSEKIKNFYLEKKEQANNSNISFINLKSPADSCGDEIDFLIFKKNNKVLKVNFSNENCCIITAAAANIASSYLEKGYFSHENLNDFVSNIEKMITKKIYDKSKVREFSSFSGIEDLYGRSNCLKIIIDFIKEVFK